MQGKDKTIKVVRWGIVGKLGLYVGQQQTRKAAIDEHCEDRAHWGDGRDDVWAKCRKHGDRSVKLLIAYREPRP